MPGPSTQGVPRWNGIVVLLYMCIQLCIPGPEARAVLLALALLVTRVGLADDHDVSVAANDAALLADRLDAGVDLHDVLLSRCLRSPASIEDGSVTFQQNEARVAYL